MKLFPGQLDIYESEPSERNEKPQKTSKINISAVSAEDIQPEQELPQLIEISQEEKESEYVAIKQDLLKPITEESKVDISNLSDFIIAEKEPKKIYQTPAAKILE